MHEANELAADEVFYFKSQAELYVENMATSSISKEGNKTSSYIACMIDGFFTIFLLCPKLLCREFSLFFSSYFYNDSILCE